MSVNAPAPHLDVIRTGRWFFVCTQSTESDGYCHEQPFLHFDADLLPNAEPHLGHVYTTLCADTVARYHRLAGDETFFLTGTDEHGIKMVKTAAERKVEPQELVDGVVKAFQETWKEFGVTNDDFIRTT